MEEMVTGTSWNRGPTPPERTGGSWFQQYQCHHFQTLASKGALVLSLPSHQPAAAAELMAGGQGVGGLGQAARPGGACPQGDGVQSPSRCRPSGNRVRASGNLCGLCGSAEFFPVDLGLLSSHMGKGGRTARAMETLPLWPQEGGRRS